jgi:hypothetical protein
VRRALAVALALLVAFAVPVAAQNPFPTPGHGTPPGGGGNPFPQGPGMPGNGPGGGFPGGGNNGPQPTDNEHVREFLRLLVIMRDLKLDKGFKFQDGLKVILGNVLKNMTRGWPDPTVSGLLGKLNKKLEWVNGIRDEITRLACTWPVSQRTRLLRDLYLRPIQLCRDQVNGIWGGATMDLPSGRVIVTTDPEMHELVNYTAATTSNLVSQRIQASLSWREKFAAMFGLSSDHRTSPGEAERDDALARAQTAEVMTSNHQLLLQDLWVKQVTDSVERADERSEKAVAFAIWSSFGSSGRQ